MTKLLESDFLTVNIGSILKTQKSFDDLKPNTKNRQQVSTQKKNLYQISDWGRELKDRLAANNQLEPGQQRSDYEVEIEFFEDFFRAIWDDEAEQLLSLGEPLRKVLKVLGFDKNTNPILSFLMQRYVIERLIKTKYININTFKALYNAVAKNLVANSEFFKVNDYNIIYCQDLYKRSASEMEKYLLIQKNILSPSTDAYTATIQKKNKLVFFYLDAIKELDYERRKEAIKNLPKDFVLPNATNLDTTLNSIELINKLYGNNKPAVNRTEKKHNSNAESLSKNITNKADAFAALQQLSMTTDAPEALAAMQHDSFKSLSIDDVIKATARIKPILQQTKLSGDEIRSFIDITINRLE